MTHPFHPLQGKVLEVVDRRRAVGGERVKLEVELGHEVWLPGAWTSLGPTDPFVELSGGRSLFRVEDLVRLAVVVAELDRELHPACAPKAKGEA